jgi:predicted TIM-barrel enzyme
MKYLTPVIHVKSLKDALLNAVICQQAGTHGFFLINHAISCNKLADIYQQVRQTYPNAWIGINVLDRDPLSAIPKFKGLDGYWVDDPRINELATEQPIANQIRDSLRFHNPKALYFGSVAFKYQVQPINLAAMTQLAAKHVDIITTSGEGTGKAADLHKIQTMRAATKHPLALASGITPDNVADYLPLLDWFLVATGISKTFHELDPEKVAKLQTKISQK